MDQAMKKATYKTILGQGPEVMRRQKPIVVSVTLPRFGEHGFEWKRVAAIGKEYGHFGFRLHPKANPVNIQIYGDQKIIKNLARSGTPAVCELELVVKRLEDGREYILTNLYLTDPRSRLTHEFQVTAAPQDRPEFVYTTNNMYGTGISVRPM